MSSGSSISSSRRTSCCTTVFEQALALVNAASILRSGGLVLTNTAVLPLPPMRPQAGYLEVVYSPRQHDQCFWYRKE